MESDLVGLNLASPDADRVPPKDRALAAGLAAAAASLAVSGLLRVTVAAPLIPERLADRIFAVTPISVVEIGVGLLGPYAKRFAFVGCVMVFLTVLAYAGVLYSRFWPEARIRTGLLFGSVLWLVSSLAVFPALGGGVFGIEWRPGPVVAVASLLAAALVYGASVPWLIGRFGSDESLARRASRLASRRMVLRAIAMTGVGVVVYEGVRSLVGQLGLGSQARVKGGTGTFPDIDGLSREITPAADFYHVSKNVFDPDGPPADWRLEIGGSVQRPRSYTLEELRELPSAESYATLACISNHVGGDLISTGLWRGVSLAAILTEAGIEAGAVDVLLTAFDDYTDSIPVERALLSGTLLAYELNSEPLRAENGAPLRLIAPGIYGMKNVKWIKRVEVVQSDVKGYWQRRGWDDRAEYQTMSRIDVARATVPGAPATLAGVAFAGDRGISRVEVSVDRGQTWFDAEIRPPLSPYTWVLWQAHWVPEREGKHVVSVRATDGRGDVQPAREAPPEPHGATGLHSVALRV